MRSLFTEIGWALWSLKIWFLQRFEYVRHLEDEVTRLENQLEDPSHTFDSFLDSCQDDDDWEDDDDDDWEDDDWDDESLYDYDGDDDEWDEGEDSGIIDTELADERV